MPLNEVSGISNMLRIDLLCITAYVLACFLYKALIPAVEASACRCNNVLYMRGVPEEDEAMAP